MRRLLLFLAGLLLTGALLVAPSGAIAGASDWAVNGVALPPGQQIGVKFASVTPIQLTAPAAGIDITCASWKAKGTLTGGTPGTGVLIKPKLTHCTQAEPGHSVTVKLRLEEVSLRTGPAEAAAPSTIEVKIAGVCFKKPRCEPPDEINGLVDGLGPDPAEGNLLEFPQPSLPASSLTFGGVPAELAGQVAFLLPKDATLSQIEP